MRVEELQRRRLRGSANARRWMRERISCNERGIPYDEVDVVLTARQLKGMATRYRDRYSDLIYRQADLRERKRISRARAAKRKAS